MSSKAYIDVSEFGNKENKCKFADKQSQMMTVSVCTSEDGSDCKACICTIDDCTQYDFGVWMYFKCDVVQGNYLRLTNGMGNFNVAAEIEAFGYISEKP